MFRHNLEIDARDKQVFCLSLGQLTARGTPLLVAIEQASVLVPAKRMRKAAASIAQGILDGHTIIPPSLTEEFPELDDGKFVSEIEWGEEIGELDEQLFALARMYKKQLREEPIHFLAESQSLSTFSRLLLRACSGGLSLHTALRSTQESLAKKRLPLTSAVVGEIADRFKQGCSLHDCLAAYPEVFPSEYVSAVENTSDGMNLLDTFRLLTKLH